MHVVVDADGGFDDVKAILYLLERPDVELLAVAVSGTGIAHCPEAARNIAGMLAMVGASEIPVACGRTTPLEGSNEAPIAFRNAADTLGGVYLPEVTGVDETDAVTLLRDTLQGAKDVVLLAIGPLTNVAEALEQDAALVDNIEMIYLMGGAVDVGGNVLYANPDAEFNIWADPRAATMVFATDVPITMIPLDATNAVPVTPYLYDVVAAHRDTSPATDFLAQYLDVSPLYGGMYHWDELAAVAVTDESVVTIEERRVAVIDEGGAAAGATVEADDGRSIRMATDADRELFEELFYRAVLRTGDTGVVAWAADATLSWDGVTCEYQGPDPLLDAMWIRIDNTSSAMIAWIVGSYAPGTTTDDWDDYVAGGADAPPAWWRQQSQIIVPAGAHDVWQVSAGADATALCVADTSRIWEVAGPRLSG
jgi:pyrimidine-specific ribonucleoside hydrolase